MSELRHTSKSTDTLHCCPCRSQRPPGEALAGSEIHTGSLPIDLVLAHEPEEATVAAIPAEIAHREDLARRHLNRRDVGSSTCAQLERRSRVTRQAIDEDMAFAHLEAVAADGDDALDKARPAIG